MCTGADFVITLTYCYINLLRPMAVSEICADADACFCYLNLLRSMPVFEFYADELHHPPQVADYDIELKGNADP